MKTRDFLKSLLAAVALFALVPTLAGQGQGQGGPGRVNVLIGFRGGPNAEDVALVRAIGGNVNHVYRIVPAMAASVPEAALAGLGRDPRVTVIEEDGLFFAISHTSTTGTAELNNTWGVKHIGSGAVHARGNMGAGVRVAVIDSGVNYNHADLAANYQGGHDFVNNDSDPMDDNGHGTHVAGTIAAAANGLGVVGVAPDADLYALKVLAANGSGSFSAVISALQWAVDNQIQVSNNSYGSGSDPGTIVRAAFDNSAAQGVLHIAAAGNSGTPSGKGNNVGYPARYDSVVAVAATDQNDNRASFSSTGPAVELAAPGVGINSTLLGGGYGTFSGTSMASPHVAGVAALVIASGVSDSTQVRTILQNSAKDLGASGRDSSFGFGLVDADAAAPGSVATGTIAGTVTASGDGGAPIAGAAVVVNGTGLSATTDSDGTYAIAGVPVGSHTVTASASGFESKSQEVSVLDGETSTAYFTLDAATTATTATVSAITYSTSGGRDGKKDLYTTVAVNDNLGASVGGASVAIQITNGSNTWNRSGTTGSNGQVTFKLANAPSGTYSTTVNGLTASGLTWDGVTPPNSFTK